MPVDRKKILTQLGYYKDPVLMKQRYGIDITREQIQAAERAIAKYKALPEQDLKSMDERKAMIWPYRLSEHQRYDKIVFETGITLTITQIICWNQIRRQLEQTPENRKTNGRAICAALREIEEFMQLNMYVGNFDENAEILQGRRLDQITGIFDAAYKKNDR